MRFQKTLLSKLQMVFLASALLAACAPSPDQVTQTAEMSIVQTQTAAPTLTPSITPTPSRTPRPTTDFTATVVAKATKDQAYLEDAVAPDLEVTGLTLDQGKLAYQMKEAINITIAQGGSWHYWEPVTSSNPTFSDFVLGVDVTWYSQTGRAGCAILFRAESDVLNGEYAEFGTIRLSGFPGWDFAILKFNDVQDYLTTKNQSSSAIHLESGSINHYVLVAIGKIVTVYANGTRLGSGTLPEHLSEGRIFFQTWQESNQTTCIFDNAWIWDLSE
jgi:hypothetical protein